MLLGVGLIIVGILITSITTYYEIKKVGGISINWLAVLVFPGGLYYRCDIQSL